MIAYIRYLLHYEWRAAAAKPEADYKLWLPALSGLVHGGDQIIDVRLRQLDWLSRNLCLKFLPLLLVGSSVVSRSVHLGN